MKFTKEEAGKALAAKLALSAEDLSKWSRTISENVETLCKIYGEESDVDLETFVNNSLPLFNTTAGFLRKVESDLTKTYDAKIKELEGKVKPTPTPTPPAPDPNDDFIKRLEALEEENKRQKEIIKNKELSEQLVAKMKEKGIKSDKWIEALMPNVSFGENFNVDEAADKYLTLYNTMRIVDTPQITPQTPNGGENKYQNDTIKAAAAMVKQSSLVGQ